MSPLESSFGAMDSAPQAPFSSRHIGLNAHDVTTMLATLGTKSLDVLMEEVVPANIRRDGEMQIGAALSEAEVLAEMRELASRNQIKTSMIGMGYYGTHTAGDPSQCAGKSSLVHRLHTLPARNLAGPP